MPLDVVIYRENYRIQLKLGTRTAEFASQDNVAESLLMRQTNRSFITITCAIVTIGEVTDNSVPLLNHYQRVGMRMQK